MLIHATGSRYAGWNEDMPVAEMPVLNLALQNVATERDEMGLILRRWFAETTP